MRSIFTLLVLTAAGLLPAQAGYWEQNGAVNLRSGQGAPAARGVACSIWKGNGFWVFGGATRIGSSTVVLNDGGTYLPDTDSWALAPGLANAIAAPSPRMSPSAVWTGNLCLAFGGADHVNSSWVAYSDGGAYDPTVDAWVSKPNLNAGIGAPSARMNCMAVWTGSQMVVFGGHGLMTNGIQLFRYDGGIYDPLTDTWVSVPTLSGGTGLPEFNQGMVWTGHYILARGGQSTQAVYPGSTGSVASAGGMYDPTTDQWIPTPHLRSGLLAYDVMNRPVVWTGLHLLEFGGTSSSLQASQTTVWGLSNYGVCYDPYTDSLAVLPNLSSGIGAPQERRSHIGHWIGSHMFAWSGIAHAGNFSNYWPDTGGLYDPIGDVWLATPSTNVPSGRVDSNSEWTGDRVVIWSGGSGGSLFTDGGVYIPPRVAPTIRNLDPSDIGGSASNPLTVNIGERLKHRIVCYGCPEAIIVPTNLPGWLTVGFGGPTQLVAAGTGLGNGGQNGEPPGIGAPFNPWFSAEGGTADGQWIHGTPTVADVGTYAIQLRAHNGVAPDSATYTVYIEVLAPPGGPSFTTPIPPSAAVAGELYTAPVAATGNPPVTSINLSGHAWLSYSSGVVSGIPPVSAGGTTQGPFILTASNGQPPDAVQVFNLTVAHAYTDVNRDRAVNVSDVQLTVNIILGLAQKQWPEQGDTNRDSVVNVIDVQQVVNKILNP